jgi:hypothetical protein
MASLAATIGFNAATQVFIPVIMGVGAGLLAWYFELNLQEFLSQYAWALPALTGLAVAGVSAWLL